jgi:polysaccharide biosynthesis/export protein
MRPLFIIFLLFNILAFAQKIPDYKERSITAYSDTSRMQNISLSATEGAINPEEYILGPGDLLFISISGLEERTFSIPVDHEGSLYIPKVGGLNIRNSSLAEVKKKITQSINRYYKDVDVFITLAEFKKIKVSLIGDVVKPATFILPGNARLIDAITVSSGLNTSANYRNIKIINEEKVRNVFDLLKFLRYGNISHNPQLREGDIIIIDKVDEIISVSGSLKYPGSYEFVEGETVADIITVAGGLLNNARKDSIEVISFDSQGISQNSRYFDYKELTDNKILLKNKDHVIVREIADYMIDRYVLVTGFIKYPGYYKIIKDKTTIYDIINEAGGFKNDASLTEATITRNIGSDTPDPEFERLKILPRSEMTEDEYDYLKAKSRQRVGKVVVDFNELFVKNNLKENITLIEGDLIDIPQKKNYVTILGQVVNPGNIIYNSDYTYEDYINLAGGFGWRALESEVRIVRANTGEWVYADDTDYLEPGDAIWVPEDPPGAKFWDVFTTSLNVLGQIAAVIAAVFAVVLATR